MRKKLWKKMTGIVLATGMLAGCLTGCGGTTQAPGGNPDSDKAGVEEVDNNKTQLVIATFDGGLGTTWITDSAERFEEEFADVSFEEGKKGVQVSVVRSSNYAGNTLMNTMQYETADVFFTEVVEYYEHLKAGNFADITDIVTEDLTKYGEKESIEDKIDADYRDFLNVGTADKPQYYAIPFYDSFYGLSYDQGMFAKQNLYFKTSGTEAGDAADSIGFVSSDKDKKSAGVDGKYGTYDDGLPATYAQFLKLLEKMVEKDITPLIYGGSNAIEYPLRTMTAFLAQAEGAEGYRLNATFDGTADNLVKLDANGKPVIGANNVPKLESLKITENNGYELQRQAGRYYVLQLFQKILANAENYSDSSMIHTAAQSSFLKGTEEQYDTYGMLIDGSWWVNEAADSFAALANRYGEGYAMENRKLAFMPLPVPNAEDVGKGSVLLNANTSLAFVRSNTDIMDCAKAFLQFTTTDAELSAFTSSVSMTRSFDYEIAKEHKEKLTPYGKSIWELKSASSVVYPYSKDKFFQNNQASFVIEQWSFSTVLSGTGYSNPWQFWLAYADQATAADYFAGMYQNQKTRWNSLVK